MTKMPVVSQGSAALEKIGEAVRTAYVENRRLLSYAEYLTLVKLDAARHCRNSAQYLRDMFDYYGTEKVEHPRGRRRRFKLFDAPFDGGEARLAGQEDVQNRIYGVLSNFVRQRRVDRFVLLHGPNGSSKSTVTDLIARAMEHYSATDEGALYRFSWIFPVRSTGKSGIGFHGDEKVAEATDSYVHLDESEIDARLPCELNDHPLLLLPPEYRQALFAEVLDENFPLSDYLRTGDLSHKSKLVYEALLASYSGDYLRVLRHVQIERFYISRRFRSGTVRVEPQMAVDARSRQVTADRSLSALPAALQNIALYELEGDLVDANRGLADYADLLKRPIEAFRYLLTAVESGRVALDPTNLFIDLVFLGSANSNHLNAFMESPEWMSFKARMELVRVPYLRDYMRERQIYELQVTPQTVGLRIAPHAISVAALWAVLTRMHRPDAARYPDEVSSIIGKLTPLEKAELFATKKVPEDVGQEAGKSLRAVLEDLYGETDSSVIYEGRTGASPREIRSILLNAAERAEEGVLTTETVLAEIASLTKERSVYAFLRQEPQSNGYFDHAQFIDVCRHWYLDRVDDDVRSALGLVDEASYAELFERYVSHVTHHVRKERLKNPITGEYDDPDESLMRQVEQHLDVVEDVAEFRQSLMTRIGAWSIDNPGQRPAYAEIFAEQFQRLRAHYHAQQKKRVGRILSDALKVLAGDKSAADPNHLDEINTMRTRLKEPQFGYCEISLKESLTALIRDRYSD
ncbi:MAG: serine protein kinase PrkA [Deltaproteobacteria bacterium]|nr:serine protein kinase PrkA [Deltaproteobacteria bacterium]